MRRLAHIPALVLACWWLWKVVLLSFTAQPIPANDAFFYDGAVVNYLAHGRYCNPALAEVLPISGREVFSAYPPLYQAVLLGWLKIFGTSALATMWLHVGLLGAFAGVVARIFQQLELSAVRANVVALFLFGITFHDRPDTLAHVLGALALLAWLRSQFWPGIVFLLLTVGTSLQIGAIYGFWVGGLSVINVGLAREKFPWGPWLTWSGGFVFLVGLVKYGYPQLWAGFQEHATMTPSFTGLRIPERDEWLKVIRAAPGILLVILTLPWWLCRTGGGAKLWAESLAARVLGAGLMTSVILIGGSLFVVAANQIAVAGYLQPLVVGTFLAVRPLSTFPRWQAIGFAAALAGAVVLVSLRAVGQSTWGVWCARDVSYRTALRELNHALDTVPAGQTVVVSAAYLYETARRADLTWIHSDWPARSVVADWELRGLERLQPTLLVLTQFDYYRRYETVIAQLRRERGDVAVRIENFARVQAPEADPRTRKIVQHLAWAPVIIYCQWPVTATNSNSPQ